MAKKKYASYDEIREFNNMVRSINADLRAIEKVDPDAITLERYRGYYQTINPRKKMDAETFRELKRSAKELLASGQLSLEGRERAMATTIKTLKDELGIDYINKRNFKYFFRFMEDARARKLATAYSSEQLLEAINKAKSKGLTRKQILANMDRWKKKAIKEDEEGKIIEVINPPKLTVRKIKLSGNKRK